MMSNVRKRLFMQYRQSGYDHNWDTPEAILADSAAAIYVAGAAFHGYAGGPSAQSRVHYAYPDKEIYFTECSDGGWSPD
jgi:glucosylceramidase